MTQADIAQSIAALFDGEVGVGVTDPRAAQPVLMAAEAPHVARAIDKRQREFAAGRAAARVAMAQLGAAAQAIPAAKTRAPIWPEGWQGSISHKDTLCAAVVTKGAMTLGLDLEETTALDEKLIPSICAPKEIAMIDGPDMPRLAKLIFCAKEAAYKAQFPQTGKLFGFDHLDVALDLAHQRFTATFLQPAGIFDIGATLLGRYTKVAGHFVTAVSIPQLTTTGRAFHGP